MMRENLRNLCKQLMLANMGDAFETVEFSAAKDFLTNVFTEEIERSELTNIERFF